MIAVVADLKESRKLSKKQKKVVNTKVRTILDEIYARFAVHCKAIPEQTQGDSVELLVTNWKPIIFLFHRALVEGLVFRFGIGTGKIIVFGKKADECDGPAFWNAREALNKVKQSKYMASMAGFRIDNENNSDENNMVINSVLFLAALQGLTRKQLQCCYYLLWEKKQVVQIAEIMQTTKSNVSKILNKTPCYLLAKIIAL